MNNGSSFVPTAPSNSTSNQTTDVDYRNMSRISLPPTVFNASMKQEVGVVYSYYSTSILFPLAGFNNTSGNCTDSTCFISSPVIAASVVSGDESLSITDTPGIVVELPLFDLVSEPLFCTSHTHKHTHIHVIPTHIRTLAYMHHLFFPQLTRVA